MTTLKRKRGVPTEVESLPALKSARRTSPAPARHSGALKRTREDVDDPSAEREDGGGKRVCAQVEELSDVTCMLRSLHFEREARRAGERLQAGNGRRVEF